jgi:hypothetical protein
MGTKHDVVINMIDEERWQVIEQARRTCERLRDFEPEQRDDLVEDPLQRWAANRPRPEPEPPQRKLDTAPAEADWSAWQRWLDSHLEADWLKRSEIIGLALGQALDLERKKARDELAAEVRKLWSVLTELQQTMGETQQTIAMLNRLRSAERAGEPVELPSLPLRRDIN